MKAVITYRNFHKTNDAAHFSYCFCFIIYFYTATKSHFMRFPLFIPLILCDLFCVLMLITSFNVGPTWKFILSLAGVVVFTITAILAGGAILRQSEVKQNEGHH